MPYRRDDGSTGRTGPGLSRIIPPAIAVGGVGLGLSKSLSSFGGVKGALGGFIGSTVGDIKQASRIQPRAYVPKEFQESLLQEAFDIADDVMSPTGKAEFVKQAYERALYTTGIVSGDKRKAVLKDLLSTGTRWEDIRKKLLQYENQVGGMENVYRQLTDIARTGSGSVGRGTASEFLGKLTRERGNIPAYPRSSFEPAGRFWKDLFPGASPRQVVPGIETIGTNIAKQKNRLEAMAGMPVSAGLRMMGEEIREFKAGQYGNFAVNVPGVEGAVNLPFVEYRVGGAKSKMFMEAPTIPSRLTQEASSGLIGMTGKAFVASDHKGMAFSAVPHFAVADKAGNYKIVDWNQFVNISMFGDERYGIEGYAQKIHRYHQEGKNVRQLMDRWRTLIHSQMFDVTGTRGSMVRARQHMQSVVSLNALMQHVETGQPLGMKGLEEFYTGISKTAAKMGLAVSAPGSPGPMAEVGRLMLTDLAQGYDVFGGGYPMERRYLSRFRDLELTDKSRTALKSNKILGILNRETPITATAMGIEQAYGANPMPSAVGFFSLKGTGQYGAEEAVLSKNLGDIAELRDIQTFYLRSDVGRQKWVTPELAEKGFDPYLMEGEEIGFDYRTGKKIQARHVANKLRQRVVGVEQQGNVVRLSLETTMPLQDQAKIFGLKLQVQQARGKGVSDEMINEFKVGQGKLLRQIMDRGQLEMAGSAKAFKGVGPEIHKQMSEALWFLKARKLGGQLDISRVAREERQAWKYVHREGARRGILQSMAAKGARAFGENTDLGVGLQILKKAKKMGLSSEGIGLVGGLFYETMANSSAVGEAKLNSLLREYGMGHNDIMSLKNAEGVIAMPTLHFGDIASQFPWDEGSVDPRALREIKAQAGRWGTGGEAMLEEIVSRIRMDGSGPEISMAAKSLTGESIPEDIKRINKLSDAKNALGEQGFVLEHSGKSIYIPGPEAKGMGTFTRELGYEQSQHLRSSYERYISALEDVRDFGDDTAQVRLNNAEQSLREVVHKEYAASRHLGGKLFAAESPMARSFVGEKPGQAVGKMYESIEEFINAKSGVFEVGLGKQTAQRMFRKQIAAATTSEQAEFLMRQRDRFFDEGGTVTGMLFRHPTHKVQSTVPVKLRLAGQHEEGIHFIQNKLKLGKGTASERVLDVSTALGMNLDTDGDHATAAIIGDAKRAEAIEQLMKSEGWRRQFVEDVDIKYGLEKIIKNASKAGDTVGSKALRGLERLAGVKASTGPVSSLVSQMRAAASFMEPDSQKYALASHLFGFLEEAPISSKHGLLSGDIAAKLSDFVNRRGPGVNDALRDVWMNLFKTEEMEVAGRKFRMDSFINDMADHIKAAQESGDFRAFKETVLRQNKAAKGQIWEGITQDELRRVIKMSESGKGDILYNIRHVMTGESPGSFADAGASVVASAARKSSAIWGAFKRNWKYPAGGLALALGASYMASPGAIDMPRDHDAAVAALDQGYGIPSLASPDTLSVSTYTTGGGSLPPGMSANMNIDYGPRGVQRLATLAGEMGAILNMRDNRGAVTPEYIDKAQRERYV